MPNPLAIFSAVALCAVSLQTYAASADECTRIADDQARLLCYDEALEREGESAIKPQSTPAAGAKTQDGEPVVQHEPISGPGSPPAAPRVDDVGPKEQIPPHAPEFAIDGFGLDDSTFGTPRRRADLDEITARIAALAKDFYGAYLIALDNGQVWEENARSRAQLRIGQEVTIARRTLGAYKLRAKRSASTDVHRLDCDSEYVGLDRDAKDKCAHIRARIRND